MTVWHSLNYDFLSLLTSSSTSWRVQKCFFQERWFEAPIFSVWKSCTYIWSNVLRHTCGVHLCSMQVYRGDALRCFASDTALLSRGDCESPLNLLAAPSNSRKDPSNIPHVSSPWICDGSTLSTVVLLVTAQSSLLAFGPSIPTREQCHLSGWYGRTKIKLLVGRCTFIKAPVFQCHSTTNGMSCF